MNGRRVMIGLCALCAVLVSAIAAQGASAQQTTAYTCKMVPPTPGTAGFSKAHCKPEDAVTTEATYEHFSFPVNTTTNLSISNEKVGPKTETTSRIAFRTLRAGVKVGLEASKVEPAPETATCLNHVFNRENAKGEMFIEGTGCITFTGVKVIEPAGKGCVVAEEMVTTEPLNAKTETGLANQLNFVPPSGVFAKFNVTGCSVAGLNGAYEVTGTVKGSINGATVSFTHAGTTEQGTLKLGGQNAGIEGEVTFSGKLPTEETFTPLSVT